MDFKSLIMNGRSVRNYKDTPVDAKKLTELEQYVSECKKLDDSIEVETRFFAGDDTYKRLYGIAGYKGVMIEAPNYLVLLSEDKPHHLENAGYVGERAILKARDLGIDSCWISYSDRNAVKNTLGIDTDKEVVALIALGYASSEKKIEGAGKTGDNYSQSNLSVSKGSSDRIALEEMVFIDKWGNSATAEVLEERALLDAFSYSRMAPSSLNKQPWRFIVDGGKVVLAINNENYSGSYANKIDAGIIMLYFGVILDVTMFDSKWGFDEMEKDYGIPQNYKVVGYCNI
ncbi:MAG: nitroreductase family protein [Peptostreptococcus porci]|uniref:Nitroreductase n=1 Tax=Peptostreptococcus porci TaxID=2652282 RepID=A0A6N7XEF9_9FIRM|nr:nitroreductase family protein [Peptostreptococcus porci]MDY2794487.1 nitroreductase family protein [Peptostreptococcus porci]MDY5479030.1 nitroreductase family protein [Peptostreptococcus porci]MST63096.1 nitroreductase [Peptostreptococcus porci]